MIVQSSGDPLLEVKQAGKLAGSTIKVTKTLVEGLGFGMVSHAAYAAVSGNESASIEEKVGVEVGTVDQQRDLVS